MLCDAELDPTTCDYTGSQLSHLGNAVYVRLMTPLGSWWADPALGSRLHELQRSKDLARVRILAEQLRGIKGKCVISLNDTLGVREAFAGFNFEPVRTTYTCAASNNTPAAELLITNF